MASDSDINIEITEETPVELSITEDTPVNLEIVGTGPQGDNTSADQVSYDNTYANSQTDDFFVGVVEQQGFDDRIIDAFLGIQSAVVFLQNNKVTSVIAGNNVTITGTALNPIINASGGGGGSGMEIGLEVVGADNNRMLTTDGSGNLADDQFEALPLNIGLGPGINLLGNILRAGEFGGSGITFGGIDLTIAGLGKSYGIFTVPGETGAFVFADIDPSGNVAPKSFLLMQKTGSDQAQILFTSNGIGGGQADLTIDSQGIRLANGGYINEFSTDGTLGGNSDSALPTEKAVKTYVGNGFVPYTGASTDVDLGSNDITAQNGILGGGTGAGVTLEVGGTTDMYYLSMQGTMTIDNNRDATLNSVNIDGVAGFTSAGALTATTGSFTGDVLIDKAQPILRINRTNNAAAGLVEYATGGTTEWYFGEYSAGVSDFELHKSGGGSSGFIVRYADQFVLIRYGLNLNYLGTNNVPYIDGSRNLVASIVTPTELGYLSGVTSAIQTQLGNKQPLDSDLTTIAGLTATTDNFIVSVASAWASRTPAQVRTTLGLVIGTNVQAWDADLDTWATKTAPSGTVIGTTDTQTLTNKRMTRRVVTVNAPGATPTTNSDNADVQTFTGLATAITSMTTNLSGTPVDGDLIEFRFLDDGTARAIAWGSSFVASGTVTLPTTTVISTTLRVGFEYSTLSSLNKWVCVAKS